GGGGGGGWGGGGGGGGGGFGEQYPPRRFVMGAREQELQVSHRLQAQRIQIERAFERAPRGQKVAHAVPVDLAGPDLAACPRVRVALGLAQLAIGIDRMRVVAGAQVQRRQLFVRARIGWRQLGRQSQMRDREP